MQVAHTNQRPTQRIRQWISDALFTRRSAADYFAPLIQAVDPDWAPGRITATIEAMQTETPDTKTFIVRPQGNGSSFKAGQHVVVDLEINGRTHHRTFTIASTPEHFSKTGTLALTIKKTDHGKVTPWLHHLPRPGVRMGMSSASGKFLLPETLQGSLLYFAAGSGITPVMSHLRTLVEQTFPLPVTLVYYARTQEEFIFLKELKAIAKASPRFQLLTATTQDPESKSSLKGRICPEHVQAALQLRKPSQVYVCGPQGFAATVQQCLSSTEAHDVPLTREFFGGLVATGNNTDKHQILFSRSERVIEGSAQHNLLETAEQNGLTPNAGCRMGICYTCKCKKSQGRVRNLMTGEISEDGEEMIQLCISAPETDITLAL